MLVDGSSSSKKVLGDYDSRSGFGEGSRPDGRRITEEAQPRNFLARAQR